MSRERILVVDDEPQIQRFLRPALEAAGYDVVEALNGAEALKAAATAAPALVILDLGLPDMDGKDVIARLRGWSQVPIIILSARDQETEKIAALDLGADDYVEKPFGIGELTARMRTALRHRIQEAGGLTAISVDGLEIDTVRRVVERDGKASEADAEGIRSAAASGAACRPGRHPQDAADLRLGSGAWRGHALSARLHRPVARRRSNATPPTRRSSAPSRASAIASSPTDVSI